MFACWQAQVQAIESGAFALSRAINAVTWTNTGFEADRSNVHVRLVDFAVCPGLPSDGTEAASTLDTTYVAYHIHFRGNRAGYSWRPNPPLPQGTSVQSPVDLQRTTQQCCTALQGAHGCLNTQISSPQPPGKSASMGSQSPRNLASDASLSGVHHICSRVRSPQIWTYFKLTIGSYEA